MSDKLKNNPAVAPAIKFATPESRKWLSAEEAKDASKRALNRLKDQIVAPLRTQLESPVLQN